MESRFSSLSFAHPFLRSSDARSTPLISAVPMSRGTSSEGGSECVDVKVTVLPTASPRRNSRDSNAQSYTFRHAGDGTWNGTRGWVGARNACVSDIGGDGRRGRTHLVLARRRAHARSLDISEVQDTVPDSALRASCTRPINVNGRRTVPWESGPGARGTRAAAENRQRSRLDTLMIFRTEHGRAEGMGAPYISRSIGAWPRIIHIAMQHEPFISLSVSHRLRLFGAHRFHSHGRVLFWLAMQRRTIGRVRKDEGFWEMCTAALALADRTVLLFSATWIQYGSRVSHATFR